MTSPAPPKRARIVTPDVSFYTGSKRGDVTEVVVNSVTDEVVIQWTIANFAENLESSDEFGSPTFKVGDTKWKLSVTEDCVPIFDDNMEDVISMDAAICCRLIQVDGFEKSVNASMDLSPCVIKGDDGQEYVG